MRWLAAAALLTACGKSPLPGRACGVSEPDLVPTLVTSFPEPLIDHSKSTSGIERLGGERIAIPGARIPGLTVADHGMQRDYETATQRRLTGGYCVWLSSLTVDFSYRVLAVYVTSEYPETDCRFAQTLQHEQEHVTVHREVYERYKARLHEALSEPAFLPGPGRGVMAPTAAEGKARVAAALDAVVEPIYKEFQEELAKEQGELDTPEKYRIWQASCPGW